MKGFINLIKPEGMSSAYAVGVVKKKFNLPCGHMGTLDPMASGILPVGIAKTSRLFDYLLDKEKTYVAKFKFGVLTDTLDVTGTVSEEGKRVPSMAEINSVLHKFVGEIDQIPPNYSAKCVDGKRGYQLARKGIQFELAPKKVTVLSAKCLEQTDVDEFKFEFTCKGGTYIRSLARDIASACDTIGVMSALDRTACGIFNYSNGVSVEELKNSDNPKKYLIAPDLSVSFEKLVLSNEQATKVLNGLYENYGIKDGIYRVYNETDFWGVGIAECGAIKIKSYVR
ncbi:MAG: tRNA pseudouridine(55) synthase TruB [Clostridiales bacterium]|nr:tRNA pseudouridine(55) synthase TruB [Clostridiales bacterium]